MTELLLSSFLLASVIYFYIQNKKKKNPDEMKKIPFSDTLDNAHKGI